MKREEIQHNISEIYRLLWKEELRVNHYVVVGGASLLLQGTINETDDVDISIAFPHEVIKLASVLEKGGYVLSRNRKGGRLPFRGIEFFNNNLRYDTGLIGCTFPDMVQPYLIYEVVELDGVKIPVRPKRLIKIDYERSIESLRGCKDEEEIIKAKKYKERLALLNKR